MSYIKIMFRVKIHEVTIIVFYLCFVGLWPNNKFQGFIFNQLKRNSVNQCYGDLHAIGAIVRHDILYYA